MTDDRQKQKAKRAALRQRNLVEKHSPYKPKRHPNDKRYMRDKHRWIDDE